MTSRIPQTLCAVAVALAWFGSAPAALAQDKRPVLVEGGIGHASFVDDAPVPHTVFSGSARVFLTPRIAIGPEVAYMRGPNIDRDWFFTGNATFELTDPSRSGVFVRPYLIAGGGLMRSTLRVGIGSFTSSEGTFTAGFGARFSPNDTWFVAPEFRIGWELHTRLGFNAGYRFK